MSEIIVNISQTEELVTLNVVPIDNPITLNVVEDVTLVTLNVTTGSTGSGNASNTENIVAGEDLIIGNLVYLSTDGKWYKTDYLIESKISPEVRWVKTNILTDATGEAYIFGLVLTTGLTTGARYCVGANGAFILESSIPDTEGIFIRYIGTAKSTTELEFYPDGTYIETTLVPSSSDSFDPLVDNIGDITPVNSPIVDNDNINDFASKTQGQIDALSLATGGINRTVVTTASNVTAGSTAKTDYVYFLTGSNTLTLPTAVGNTNKYLIIRKSASVVSIASTSSETFNGVAGPINLNVDKIQIELISDDSNWTY